jgi:hypothetical protein
VLKGLRKFLNYTGPIEIRTRIQKSGFVSHMCSLRVSAPDLVSRLIQLGIVPKKSFRSEIPKKVFDTKMEQFFFRGLFDGDGCIHIRKDGSRLASLCGHPNVIDSFRNLCWNKIREVGSLHRRSPTLHVVLFPDRAVKKLRGLLYGDRKGPRLKRKENLLRCSKKRGKIEWQNV